MFGIHISIPKPGAKQPVMERAVDRQVERGPAPVKAPHPVAVLKIRLGKIAALKK